MTRRKLEADLTCLGPLAARLTFVLDLDRKDSRGEWTDRSPLLTKEVRPGDRVRVGGGCYEMPASLHRGVLRCTWRTASGAEYQRAFDVQ